MDHRIHLNVAKTVLLIAIGFAVSALASALIAARAYQSRGEQELREDRTITVKGSTRKRIRSDRAVWQIGVEGHAADLRGAFAAIDAAVQRVRQFLQTRGFKPEEIGLGAIDTCMHYARDPKGNETRTVDEYTLSRTFFVTTADVDRVCGAAGQVTELIQEGLLVISRAPEYYYSELPRLKIDLMGAASKDARARADEIAKNAGCRVAEVRSAHMGVLQITRPFSTEVSGYGVHDTGTIDKDVQAVVTASFRIEAAP